MDGGTNVTESFDLGDNVLVKIWYPLGGFLRERRNRRDMLRTLERVKAVAEHSAGVETFDDQTVVAIRVRTGTSTSHKKK